MTELERRDTPAWWAVTTPVPAQGTPGTTDATHAGSLGFDAAFPPANGAVTVWADTATEAVAKALAGTVTVTLLGQSVDYTFGPATVGTTVADHKAFLAAASGSGVSLGFEDMAGQLGCDYDYDDRSWSGVRVVPAAPQGSGGGGTGGGGTGDHQAGTGTQLDPWVWDDLNSHETASVWLAVTSEGTDHLRWTYTLTNDSLSSSQPTPGINRLIMTGADTSGVDDMTASIGWVPAVGGNFISWQTPSDLAGPYLTIGQTATFSFRTPPQPRVQGSGNVGMAAYPEVDPETGQTTLGPPPGLRPIGIVTVPGVDAVQVVLTDRFGNAVGKSGLKVAKWENAFDFVPSKDAAGKQYQDPQDLLRVAGTAKIKGIDPNSGFNLIDSDDDRFNVWVYEKARWDTKNQHTQVKISTTNVVGFTDYNDAPTLVDMVRCTGTNKGVGVAGEGWFWSDSQLLVSNDVDDVNAVPGVGADESGPGAPGPLKHGYNWAVSDRTHRVALRGTVKAEYTPSVGPAVSDSKLVPMRHYVNAHVSILNAPNAAGAQTTVGVVDIASADKDFRRAYEQYAQVGILVIPHYDANVAWPTGVLLGDGLDPNVSFDVNDKLVLTAEEKALLHDASELPFDDEIEVYYINYFDESKGQYKRIGEAIVAEVSPSVGYNDSVIVSAKFLSRDPFTLAHELGHVLTNGGHKHDGVWPVNLMQASECLADTIGATKRLTSNQDLTINGNSEVIPIVEPARKNLLKR